MSKINTLKTRRGIRVWIDQQLKKGIVCATKISKDTRFMVSLAYHPDIQNYCIKHGGDSTLWNNLEDACKKFDSIK